MMDFEIKDKQNEDIIFNKLSNSIKQPNSLLHKKAFALIKGLKDQIGLFDSTGIKGIKSYTKNLIELLNILYKKLVNMKNYANFEDYEEDLKNGEALIFSLAVCIKQLPFQLLRNTKILEQLIQIIDNFNSLNKKRADIKKYSIIILEKLLLSRNAQELENDNDLVVKFYLEKLLFFIEESYHSEDLKKSLIKSISKIIREKQITNLIKLTILHPIKNFFVMKIRGMCIGKDNEGSMVTINKMIVGVSDKNQNVKKTSTTGEGEVILNFLSSLLQFFPFDMVNDLILELIQLIEITENKHLLLSSLLCFEMAFNTKNFALETSDKVIKILLNKELLLSQYDEGIKNFKDINFNTSLTISFIKSLTQVILNLGKSNIFIATKYLISVISLLSEFISGEDLLKNTVFNCLQNIMNTLLALKNLDILFRIKENNTNNLINTDDINIDDLTLDNNNTVDSFSIIEKIGDTFVYLTTDRFEDIKPGFNLLFTFIEKISVKQELTVIIENILSRLSERDNLIKTQTFKVFIGKLFNILPSSMILRTLPIGVLDFDICSDDFTETSKVWIISFIDKFLKNENIQTLKDFYENFYIIIEDLEKVIKKLKLSNIKNNEQMIIENEDDNRFMNLDIEEENDEEDERFQINIDESSHVKNTKIKRYELILQQIWNLLTKYIGYVQNYDVYVKELLIKFTNVISSYNTNDSSIFVYNIKAAVFKTISKIINNSFKNNDMKTLELVKKEGKIFFSKSINLILTQKLIPSEIKESFNLIQSFCKILSEKFLCKIIGEMIEKFDKTYQIKFILNDSVSNISNKAKLNESLNITLNEIPLNNKNNQNNKIVNQTNNKKSTDKEINQLCLRLEIISYILQSIKNFENDTNNTNLFELLNAFFEKFFFNQKISNNSRMVKRLIDMFLLILEKISNPYQILEILNKFLNECKGLEILSAKQKAKVFDFILTIITKNFNNDINNNFDIPACISQLHILVEIVSLTKDQNRKVRNLAYEMIGRITNLMTNSNLFSEWIKMILAILASNSHFLKSASINALARIFWEGRDLTTLNLNENFFSNLLLETSDIVLLLIKENNKEITKSIFLFIRVCLYFNQKNSDLCSKILTVVFQDTTEEVKKEFKVKIRNLLKNLILKSSYEDIKKLLPKEYETLLNYVNKHIAKKIKNLTKEEDSVYNTNMDDSVMMDNEENLLDEEEEYIIKEFNKVEKRKSNEERILEKLEKWNIEEDDPELIKKRNETEDKKEEKLDNIEQLFKTDKVELDNFFYVNPYAKEKLHSKKKKK